jgi:hypothetical protein
VAEGAVGVVGGIGGIAGVAAEGGVVADGPRMVGELCRLFGVSGTAVVEPARGASVTKTPARSHTEPAAGNGVSGVPASIAALKVCQICAG